MRNSLNKNKLFGVAALILGLGITVSHTARADGESFADRIVAAHEKGEPIPNISQVANLNMGGAYRMQAQVVKKLLGTNKIAGYKAGFTSKALKEHFGVNRPIFGMLFESGNFSDFPNVSLNNFRQLMVETEIGFIVKRPIKARVSSIKALKSHIGKIVPVIELPEMGFAHQPVLIPDLLTGMGSGGYVINKNVDLSEKDLNSLTVSLFFNGKMVNQGRGDDALGDQWEALRWLVNQVIAQGWTIQEGHILLTGALGDAVPASPGVYRAQFNRAALEVNFTVG